MNLEEALQQFDRVEANLRRLEGLLDKLGDVTPSGISFADYSPQALQYRELSRDYRDLVGALPSVGGFQIDAEPVPLDEIARLRFDAGEIDEPEILIALSQRMSAPAEELAEYRHRFTRERRALVRRRLQELVTDVDDLLGALPPAPEDNDDLPGWSEGFDWGHLRSKVAEIRRLHDISAGNRWGDLMRHLSFAEPVDLRDIIWFDWPAVRPAIESSLYAGSEPIPVEVADLGELVAERPEGAVSTALNWAALDADGFERLLFNVVASTDGYENPQRLTAINAPDRGRDLSVNRHIADDLAGTRLLRVMIQCKHYQSRSVNVADAAESVAKCETWTTPPFDVLVIATSGHFTVDGVAWIEASNQTKRLQVEMWPCSHLEMILADRAALVEEFKLRP